MGLDDGILRVCWRFGAVALAALIAAGLVGWGLA